MTGNEKRQIVAWLALPVAGVGNGVLRDTTYGRSMSEDLSHSVSLVPLCVAILAWARFLGKRWPVSGPKAALRVGLVWLTLTIAFEFGLGALRGVPMRDMLAEYNVLRGRLWVLAPLITGLAPRIALDEGERR